MRLSETGIDGFDRSLITMVEDLEPESIEDDDLAVWFTCDDDLTTRKVAALRAQASQVEPVVDLLGLDVFTAFVREEFFRDPRPGDHEIMCRIASLPPRADLA